MSYRTGQDRPWPDTPTTFRWPDELEGPWVVTLKWREIGGRMECVGFSVDELEGANNGPHILTRQDVRKIPVGDYIRRARRMKAAAETVAENFPQDAAWARQQAALFEESKGGRPRQYDDDHYRKVARLYAEGYRLGYPIKHIAQTCHVSHATAARWVREARSRHFLEKAPQRGVAGGIPPRAQPQQEEDE